VWTKHSLTTPSSFTGPQGAADGENYLYLEASSPRKTGDTVRLRSGMVRLGQDACWLRFDYHMHGSDMGTLQINVLSNGQAFPQSVTAWSKSGDQGSGWHTAQVSLQQFANLEVEVVIAGERGNGWRGDMAIDNVALETGGGLVATVTHSTESFSFRLDSPEGQVDVSGLSSVFGAIRLQLTPDATEVVKSEEGEIALQNALFSILGRKTAILGTCASTETMDALCPSTRAARNMTSWWLSSAAGRNTSQGASSFHVDFRTKIRFGNSEDAREVLGELSKLEAGNVETLDEAGKEIETAINRLNNTFVSMAPVAVIATPQPRQLKYMTVEPEKDSKEGAPTSAKEKGGRPEGERPECTNQRRG
jgi:hypothetical protein